jgi:hypothetical protein
LGQRRKRKFYTNINFKLNPLLSSDTTEDKLNKIKDVIYNTASKTLERDSSELRKPLKNINFFRDIEKKRKYKNS